jgi:hypothetical protein
MIVVLGTLGLKPCFSFFQDEHGAEEPLFHDQ